MQLANQAFWLRAKSAQKSAMNQIATKNIEKSKQVAELVKYKGMLMAGIVLVPPVADDVTYRVMSTVPYSFNIEYGIPEVPPGSYLYFNEAPELEAWVRTKLMRVAPEKALMFLHKKGVKVGYNGFPYGYPRGLRFMEQGFLYSLDYSESILNQELMMLE